MGWASLAVWLILSIQLWDKPYSTAFKIWVAICHAGTFLTIAFYAFANLKLSEAQRRWCFVVMIAMAGLVNGIYLFMPRN